MGEKLRGVALQSSSPGQVLMGSWRVMKSRKRPSQLGMEAVRWMGNVLRTGHLGSVLLKIYCGPESRKEGKKETEQAECKDVKGQARVCL